jgi:acyl-CoA thioester hydrolase
MNSILKQYPVVLTQDIIWGDMDSFDHVNNTVFFRYFEDARIAYFDKLGVREYKDKTNVGPILAHTDCNFKLPLKYPGKIQIAGRSTILSPKKFRMDYVVFSDNLDSVVAEGQGLLVYYDYNVGKSCSIPEQIVTAITRLESS